MRNLEGHFSSIFLAFDPLLFLWDTLVSFDQIVVNSDSFSQFEAILDSFSQFWSVVVRSYKTTTGLLAP